MPLLPWYSLPEGPIDTVVSNDSEFLFVFHDGTLLKTNTDSDASATLEEASEVTSLKTIKANEESFVLFSHENKITLWNDDFFGEDPTLPALPLEKQYTSLCTASFGAFATQLDDGTVVAWGDPLAGGQVPLLPLSLKQEAIDSMVATEDAFAVLLHNGSLISWGGYQGESQRGITPLLLPGHRVISLIANSKAFTALVEDTITEEQSILVWGNLSSTADNTMPQLPAGRKVLSMATSNSSFTACLDDGSLFSWSGRFGRGVITRPPMAIISIASPFRKETVHF